MWPLLAGGEGNADVGLVRFPLQEAGAGSFCWGAGSEGEKSQFGVIPCESRARDTKGHLLGKLNPNCKFRDVCLPCAAAAWGGEEISAESAGPRAWEHGCARPTSCGLRVPDLSSRTLGLQWTQSHGGESARRDCIPLGWAWCSVPSCPALRTTSQREAPTCRGEGLCQSSFLGLWHSAGPGLEPSQPLGRKVQN